LPAPAQHYLHRLADARPGVYANAVVNSALLVVLANPLIGTFGEFH